MNNIRSIDMTFLGLAALEAHARGYAFEKISPRSVRSPLASRNGSLSINGRTDRWQISVR